LFLRYLGWCKSHVFRISKALQNHILWLKSRFLYLINNKTHCSRYYRLRTWTPCPNDSSKIMWILGEYRVNCERKSDKRVEGKHGRGPAKGGERVWVSAASWCVYGKKRPLQELEDAMRPVSPPFGFLVPFSGTLPAPHRGYSVHPLQMPLTHIYRIVRLKGSAHEPHNAPSDSYHRTSWLRRLWATVLWFVSSATQVGQPIKCKSLEYLQRMK
jgi:DNA modification methylase